MCNHTWLPYGEREAKENERPLRKVRDDIDSGSVNGYVEIPDYCRIAWCPNCGLIREAWMTGEMTEYPLAKS